MIGIFGHYQMGHDRPVDLSAHATAIGSDFTIHMIEGPGAGLGLAMHHTGIGGSIAESVDGQWQAVVSGDIFNIDHLLAEVAPDDQISSAQCLLILAEQNRLAELKNANGQFCGAIYDRASHRLILITDRLSTSPIHYWQGPYSIVFATHLHTLIANTSIPRRADGLALAQVFTMQRTVGEITPFADVKAMPAATFLTVDPSGIQKTPYWSLEWRAPDYSERQAPHLLADALRQAVDRQTHGGRPGLMLSGGLDSRMVIASANRHMSCWTTASYAENPELALAREIAEKMGASFHAHVIDPADTYDYLDPATQCTANLYPASMGYYAVADAARGDCDFVLTGHGLDYTFRGYYLPARFLEVCGSSTRLPALRPIPSNPTGNDVLDNLRQGPPAQTVKRIVRQDREDRWWRGQAETLNNVLLPWLQSDQPYNAWDAFILHAVSKHYAYTGMMAVNARVNQRIPAFDNDVFDLYLRMPPLWRCQGKIALKTMAVLSPELAKIPSANTHFRADLHPWAEIASLLGRGAMRRLKLVSRPLLPSPSHSQGSWQNLGALYREAPIFRQSFMDIRDRLDSLCLGMMSPDGLAACIDEHLEGQRNHTKLLRQLQTHDAWVRLFNVQDHD